MFVAIVLDVYGRRIVGWVMATHLRTELVLDALNLAIYRRKPIDVIHHSDQGTQYTSIAFGNRRKEAGVRPSLGSVGDCYYNAMCESFNAILECELLVKHRFKNSARSESRRLRLDRGLLQPAPPAHVDRFHLADPVRTPDSCGLMSNQQLSAEAGQLQGSIVCTPATARGKGPWNNSVRYTYRVVTSRYQCRSPVWWLPGKLRTLFLLARSKRKR